MRAAGRRTGKCSGSRPDSAGGCARADATGWCRRPAARDRTRCGRCRGAREYQVQVSLDGKKWTPVAKGSISALTVAAFPPVSAKFVRLTQTAPPQGPGRLVIQNLRLFQAAAAERAVGGRRHGGKRPKAERGRVDP